MKDSRIRKNYDQFDDELERPLNRSQVNQIKCFECEKPRFIATNYFSKKNRYGKRVMKAKVSILDCSYNANKDYYNFIAFMASKFVKDPSIVISKGKRGDKEEQKDKDELLNLYNEVLMQHIKSEKGRMKTLESLKEKDKSLTF